MTRHNTFNSPESKAMIVRIHQLIISVGGATKNDIYLVTRLSDRRISQYLRHMSEQMNVVHKLVQSNSRHDVWLDGPAPKPEMIEFDDDGVDYAPRNVRVFNTWTPHHVRDSLTAALFGAPKQQ